MFRWRAVLAAPVAAGILLIVPIAGATFADAAPNCDATVVDQANVLGPNSVDVQSAAQKLEGLGADVRVRTYATIAPTTTLDQYEPSQVQQCSSWRNPNGKRKDNLVEFMVSMSPRRLAIYYGDSWVAPLRNNGTDAQIKSAVMTPLFKANNYSGGFAAGINATYDAISAYQHPAQNQEGSTTVVDNRKPTDLTGLWWVLGVIAGALLLGVILFFGFRALAARRLEAEKRQEAEGRRQAARQRALSAKEAASAALHSLEESGRQAVLASKANTYGKIDHPDATAMSAAFTKMLSLRTKASTGFDNASTAASNPSTTDLTTGVYDQIATHYQDVLDAANQAVEAADEVDRLTASIESLMKSLPGDLATETDRLTALTSQLEGMQQEGFAVSELQHSAATVQENLAVAKSTGATLAAVDLVGRARKATSELERSAIALAARHDTIVANIAQANSEIDHLNNLVSQAREAFNQISAANPPSTWEAISGNGTEAQKRLTAAQGALGDVQTQADTSGRQWDQAESSLLQIGIAVEQAASLLNAILDLETHLANARQQAPAEIADAEADLAKALAYEHDNDDDVDDRHKAELRDAESLLTEAKAALAVDQPDYLKVVSLAQAANSAADNILAESLTEVEAADRIRRQATTSLGQAEAAVSKAVSYIENHDNDIQNAARSLLHEAASLLDGAHDTGNPSRVIELAQASVEKANRSYSSARSNFKTAEQQRENAREDERRRQRQRQSNYSGYSSSRSSDGFTDGLIVGSLLSGSQSSSWGSGGSGGSGSDSGFDFGGGGGGSDSSFGSDGGGGGGSDSSF